ncbi:MAG TPA: TerD family protein [Nakamurella sp.]
MGEKVLVKGQNVALDPEASSLRLSVRWNSTSNPVDVDLVALILGADRRVRTDADMIFYNQTATADGSVVHTGKITADSGGSDDVLIDLTAVDADVHALTVAASTDGSPFSEVDRLEWLVTGEQAEPVARYPVTGLTSERALVLGEVYRREGQWRLRAVGQGWDGGLAGLATDYGVTIDSSDAPAETDGEFTEPLVEATASGGDLPEDMEPVPVGSEQESVDDGAPASTTASTEPAPARKPRKVRVAVDKPVSLPPIRLAEDPAWQSSRLFSISGIGGADEQEKRATSALLWTMAAVRPLGRALTARAGAPVGALETFIEVGFSLGEQRVIPDGVIRIARGQRVWTALVEVKTSDGILGREQIETYLRLAKRRKYDAVFTISNQISTDPDVHPVDLPARATNAVALFHISWSEIMHEIKMLLAHHRFADQVPLWILTELNRYLEHPRSGAMPFNDMGPSWVSVRESVAAGTLRPGDKKSAPIVDAWQKMVRQLCLRLTARLGVPVKQVVPRRWQADPGLRLDEGTHLLGDHGLLAATLRVPDAAGPIAVSADLRTARVTVHLEVGAPQENSLSRRVAWLSRQLRDAPDDLLVEARFAPRTETTCERLSDVRNRPQVLLPGKDWEPSSFVVSRSHPMGTKRSGARGSFVTSVNEAVEAFYSDVVERVRPWTPPAPPLPAPSATEVPSVGLGGADVG